MPRTFTYKKASALPLLDKTFPIICELYLIQNFPKFIYSLWDLMDAECSQICENAVPILLHCITLPIGVEVFWKRIEEEFHNPDWRSRFTAGE